MPYLPPRDRSILKLAISKSTSGFLPQLTHCSGLNEGDRDAVWAFFINRVREKLHIVLCMSPVGAAFRNRCRMFPSLVNCCTIDWFVQWPRDALLSVSRLVQPALEQEALQSNSINPAIPALSKTGKNSPKQFSIEKFTMFF